MRRSHVLREPTVYILLLASIVHAVRRNLFDLLLFSGTALVIALDAWRSAPRPAEKQARADDAGPHRGPALRESPTPRDTPGARWTRAGAIVIVAALLATFPRDSAPIRVLLVLVGLFALVLVVLWPGPHPRQDQAPRQGAVHGWAVWAVIGVLASLWELTGFALQQADPANDAAHPTASDLIGPLLTSWPGRAVFLLLWCGGGWWLLRQLVGQRHAASRIDEQAVAGDGRNAAVRVVPRPGPNPPPPRAAPAPEPGDPAPVRHLSAPRRTGAAADHGGQEGADDRCAR